MNRQRSTVKKQDEMYRILQEENTQNNTIIKLQKELIENLEDKIRLLEDENSQLDAVNKKFSEAYASLEELCNRQQELLDHILDGEASEEAAVKGPE